MVRRGIEWEINPEAEITTDPAGQIIEEQLAYALLEIERLTSNSTSLLEAVHELQAALETILGIVEPEHVRFHRRD